MVRDVEAIETEFNGVKYRSRTEARWAVFFDKLGVEFSYEPKKVTLSNGEWYLPDFYLNDFDAYFEVKAENDAIVTEECRKARQLAADLDGKRVWLAAGGPSADRPNILMLEHWKPEDTIEDILKAPENRYQFLEDRRDENVYWLQSHYVTGSFSRSYCIGGPGVSTNHDRLPLLHRRVAEGYEAAKSRRWVPPVSL
jgi:hypothetical protein